MAINFNDLETALYHIRVNYFCSCADGLRVQVYARGNGDTVIDVWNEQNHRVGSFFLSDLVEEIALLQQGKIDFTDLNANNAEDDEYV